MRILFWSLHERICDPNDFICMNCSCFKTDSRTASPHPGSFIALEHIAGESLPRSQRGGTRSGFPADVGSIYIGQGREGLLKSRDLSAS